MPDTPWKKHGRKLLMGAAVLLPVALLSQTTPAPKPAETMSIEE
jgi:hypothetical protein